MSIGLGYLNVAREELREALIYYENSRVGLGIALLEEVNRKIELIIKHPERYPVVHGYFRETAINRFPYVIVYRYNRSKEIVTIVSVFHTSRNPKYKYKR